MVPPHSNSDDDDSPEQAFLLRAGELLHAHGTPAHRLERLLDVMAENLGVRAAFLSTPTAMIVSFGRGRNEQTRLLRIVSSEVDLGKLVELDECLEGVEHGRIELPAAQARLEEIAAAPPRFGPAVVALAFGVASAGAARFFGGGLVEVLATFLVGLGLFGVNMVIGRLPTSDGLLVPLSAFLAAFLSLVASTLVPMDSRIVTLGGLIVLIPGLGFTVAMIELATRHLSSGVSRLAGAGAQFLTLLLGVALAWRLGGSFGEPLPHEVQQLPAWTEWLALALSPPAFAVLFQARFREWHVIALASLAGFLATRWGAASLGPELGPFLGALTVGVLSNLYARVIDRPASVPSMPAILLLVPGSLGYRSLTSFLSQDTVLGMEWGFRMALVGASLVGGLLAANLVVPPRRSL